VRVGPCALRVNQALGIRGLITKAADTRFGGVRRVCVVETVVEQAQLRW